MTNKLKATRAEGSSLVKLGDDEFRVESGPKMKVGIATKELLSDDHTAPHYVMNGPDAYGYPIEEGKQFPYLDWGGKQNKGETGFYAYQRFEVDASAPELADGSPNPYFIPEHERRTGDDPKLPQRSHFTYVFAELGCFDTEAEAIEACEKAAGKARASKPNAFPKSHLDHLERALKSPRRDYSAFLPVNPPAND